MEAPNVNQIAFVTGADRGLGLALCARLLSKGWQVFAGQYMPEWPALGELELRYPNTLVTVPLDVASDESVQDASRTVASRVDRVDLLINDAGVMSPSHMQGIRQAPDYDEMHRLYDVNALGPLRVVSAFLPLVAAGQMKRLCFVSSEAGSINRAQRTSWYGYCMSKAALNMGIKILFNRLRPEGYTFRVYHPGWMRTYMSGKKGMDADMEPEEAAGPALAYFGSHLHADDRDLWHSDEDRLVLRDWQGREWPW